MKMKRVTVMLMLLIIFIACLFSTMEEKQTTSFRVKWSKTNEGTASMKIMDYDGDTTLTGVNDITSAEISLDPIDDVTPVPAFMIRYTTNIRGYHTIQISATKFKMNQNDTGFAYRMDFTPDSFESLTIESDGSYSDLQFFVNSLNGDVVTDIKVDVIFTELDNMVGGLFQSDVTISCCTE